MKNINTITLDRENMYDFIHDAEDFNVTFQGYVIDETVKVKQLSNAGTAYRYGLSAEVVEFIQEKAKELANDKKSVGKYIFNLRTRTAHKE